MTVDEIVKMIRRVPEARRVVMHSDMLKELSKQPFQSEGATMTSISGIPIHVDDECPPDRVYIMPSETPEQTLAAARDALAHPEMLVSPGRWREFVTALIAQWDSVVWTELTPEKRVDDTYGERPDA